MSGLQPGDSKTLKNLGMVVLALVVCMGAFIAISLLV